MTRTVSRFLRPLLLVPALLLSGCATTDFASDDQARSAVDVPDRFVVEATSDAAGTTGVPAPGVGCRNPMIDPRDGTKIILVRSAADRGDYEAPTGRYGIGDRELLRLECSTGRVVGIVSAGR